MTAQTAKQQLTKKTDHFFISSTQQTVVPRNCKNNSTISQQNQKRKQTQKKRCQITLIVHTTGGRIHHRNGEMMTERRTFWTRSGIAPFRTQTNCPKRRRLRRHCNGQEKIIRGGRKNRDSSDSETRIPSRVKWQLRPDQQLRPGSRLLSFWQLIGGESKTTRNINRELVATSEETDKVPEETDQVPISITPAHPNERKLSDVHVIEADLTTTEDMESDQEVCAIEPPKRSNKQKEQKLQKQQAEESLDNLSKLFDKSLMAELTSEDKWMDRLRRFIERGDK